MRGNVFVVGAIDDISGNTKLMAVEALPARGTSFTIELDYDLAAQTLRFAIPEIDVVDVLTNVLFPIERRLLFGAVAGQADFEPPDVPSRAMLEIDRLETSLRTDAQYVASLAPYALDGELYADAVFGTLSPVVVFTNDGTEIIQVAADDTRVPADGERNYNVALVRTEGGSRHTAWTPLSAATLSADPNIAVVDAFLPHVFLAQGFGHDYRVEATKNLSSVTLENLARPGTDSIALDERFRITVTGSAGIPDVQARLVDPTLAVSNVVLTGLAPTEVSAGVYVFEGTLRSAELAERPDALAASLQVEATRNAFAGVVTSNTLSLFRPAVERALSVIADSWVRDRDPDSNHGTDNRLRITPNGDDGLVRFDADAIVSMVGAGRLEAAELQLAPARELAPGTYAVAAHRLNRNWDEQTVTFNCPSDPNLSDNGPSGCATWDLPRSDSRGFRRAAGRRRCDG